MLTFKARPRKNPTADAVLTNSERRIMRILNRAMNEVRDQVAQDEGKLLDAVMHRSDESIASMVTIEPWLDTFEPIRDELLAELIASGQRVKLPSIQKQVIPYRFDAARPEAMRWAINQSGLLVTSITTQQRVAIKGYVNAALGTQFTPAQVARGLRDLIGLTPQQATWVDNFRNRQINDRMMDGATYFEAYERSEAATLRYHNRIHRYRTETIARTEILRAVSEGRNEAWQQGVEEGFIVPTDYVKEWSTEIDGRECEICGPLNGTQVRFDEEFPQGEPPIHPNCRCDVLLVDAPITDLNQMTDDEVDTYIDESLSDNDLTEDQVFDTETWDPIDEDELMNKLTDNSKDLYQTDDDYEPIGEWVSGRSLIMFQNDLRDVEGDLSLLGNDERDRVNRLASKAIPLPENSTLYRVVPRDVLPEQLQVGDSIWDDAFATTAVRRQDYEGFLEAGGPIGGDADFTIEIRAKAGTRGVWAAPEGGPSFIPKFEEFVLLPGQRMNVVEVQDGKIIVET